MASLDAGFDWLIRSPFGWVFAGVWGALWGSFLNVCIHRIGLYESVVRPRSRCPHCGRLIRGFDNVPILSWLVLQGRCRDCKRPISVRYPLVEALACALAILVWSRFVAAHDQAAPRLLARFFVYFFFCGALVVLAGIDLDHMLLPDRITMPAIPTFFVCALLLGDVPPDELGLGSVIGYGVVAITIELSYLVLGREGMGYGDAKLLAMVGALLGWRAVAFTFFGAPFVGLVVTVPRLVLRGNKLRGTEVPYGPFLVLAALVYLFLGHLLPWPLAFSAG